MSLAAFLSPSTGLPMRPTFLIMLLFWCACLCELPTFAAHFRCPCVLGELPSGHSPTCLFPAGPGQMAALPVPGAKKTRQQAQPPQIRFAAINRNLLANGSSNGSTIVPGSGSGSIAIDGPIQGRSRACVRVSRSPVRLRVALLPQYLLQPALVTSNAADKQFAARCDSR
jgi:hypothetical protein